MAAVVVLLTAWCHSFPGLKHVVQRFQALRPVVVRHHDVAARYHLPAHITDGLLVLLVWGLGELVHAPA